MAEAGAPAERSAALRSYGLDVRQSDPWLDFLVEQAARVGGSAVALAGFLFDDRESVRSAFGWTVREFPRSSSLAAQIAESEGAYIAEDATADSNFSDHPLVTGPPHIRFYAGFPLVDGSGCFLGALSLVDRVPRALPAAQVEMLRVIAAQIVRELDLRRERNSREIEIGRLRDLLSIGDRSRELFEQTREVTRLREMLSDSDARFREFFEQTDDFVFSFASDGRLLHARIHRARRLAGTEAERVRGWRRFGNRA